ncbi:lipase 3-like isoform X1 [Thrips palmi]|uniref:Lipase n=1 Tax=Thrips palmi TaxID=161013 RepID=A0A6P8Z0Q7_THRPL|nr:lipase 3-like isoform X1 [Thrips palmi]
MPPLSERPTHCAVLVLLCLVSLAALEVLDVPGEHPAKLARSQGYLGDHHWATTEDGYLLSLFRIRNETALRAMGREKSPVLVMPGLACNAAIWVLLGPGKALAYLLADRGYDVWLGNYRGGMYARRHANLTDQDAAFWDFSFDDIGRLDVPALLQEVVALSGHPTVAYIGHSMGASVLTVMASSRPRYLERVSRAYLLAPAAYMGHALQPAVYGSAGAVSTLHGGWGLFASGEIPLNSWWVRAAIHGVCSSAMATPLCVLLGGVYAGHDSEQISQADVPLFLNYIPDSMSMKNVRHFTQHFGRERDFRRFDYGAEDNLRRYASEDAPEYNVSRSTFPASVYYGENDFLVSPRDVLAFADTLPNVIRPPYRIPYDKFSHIDFFLARDAKAFLYDQMIEDLDEDERQFVNN